jgi:signal transduction histidine kinase/phage shock protein PspC (stress-responsive transcriptional regulator)
VVGPGPLCHPGSGSALGRKALIGVQSETMAPTRARTPQSDPMLPLFRRSARDRVVVGVAGGLGERLDVDPMIVRLALVALAMAGGAGVIFYLLAWMLSADPDPASEPSKPPGATLQQTISIGCIVLGVLLLLRAAGVWFGDAWVWPVTLAVFGSAVIWTRGDEDARARWEAVARRFPGLPERVLRSSVSPARILAGALLIAGGMTVLLALNDALPELRNLVFAVTVTIAGAALIFGPGVLRLVRELSDERRDRIRSEERAEMAAHLHDSVLQTLALLQRADSASEVARLARRQERELRSWLYGKSSKADHDLLGTMIEEMATRVESIHDVAVEVVVVGDCPLDDQLRAVVAACGEAVTNAARHSGAKEVSVYVEVQPGAVEAYVRDQGRGFDPGSVPRDRRGIAESIVGRMQRSGGAAAIVSRPGEGTEVKLSLPRKQ